jgi:outer membrane receptor protein involved in Fe transport
MKQLFFLLAFLNGFQSMYANDLAPRITGMVVEATDGKTPVEFATIALYNTATNKIADGTTTDDKGIFTLTNVAIGNYKIVISFVGFADKTIENINIEKGKDLNLGMIKLATSTKNLEEVTVTSQKSLIEEKVDRTIYNAEKDITAKGGDAADVLRKVPLLSVDLDGNVSIRGNTNIKVLINNKPSTIMASSVADALKQIPADMIKTVEVITSPSAKYDAEGASGIINIITKKNDIQGYFLNVDVGGGNRSSNLGLQGSLRQGKFGATLGGHGRIGYNKASTILDQTAMLNNITTATHQVGESNHRPIFGNYNIGMDYDIDTKQSLSGGVRFGARNFLRTTDQMTQLYRNNVLFANQNQFINSKDLSNSVDLNVDYIYILKPQREFSISTQYSRNDLINNYYRNNLATSGEVANSFKNINQNLNQEGTIQMDYQTPIKENQIIEFGGKGIYRQVNSDYDYLNALGNTGNYVSDATRPKGSLDYIQKIGGLYTSYTFTTPSKYSLKTGLRYEYTDINAVQAGQKDINIPAYGVLVPSINVSKMIVEGTTLKAGYNRRIQRPGLQQLNPNFNTANVQSISVGNPNLSPELTNNVELAVSTRFKQTFLNISVFGNQTNNGIQQVRRAYDSTGAIISTYENIGKQRNVGMNIFGNVYLTPKWTVNGGFDVSYNQLEGQITDAKGLSATASNSGFNIKGRMMTNITLPNGWAIQGFGGMHGAQIQLQGKMGGFAMYSLGARKEFNNKQGTIGFAADNFLTNSVGIMRTELVTPQLTQTSVTNVYNRGFKLTFSYKFGKMGFEAKKKTRSVKNDDLKDSEGGGGDGGAAQPQGGGGGRPQGAGAPPQNGQGKPNNGGKPMDRPQGDGQGRPDNGGKPMDKPQGQGKPMPEGAPKKEAPKE